MEDIVTLEHLVKNKADLEARDETGATPLHIATQCKPNLISYFLTKRADVTATDGEGFSALAWACIKGHAPAVRELLRGYADGEALMASSSKTALSLCAERGHLECVTELLNWTAVETLNSDGSTALMCACHNLEAEVVSLLLSKNAKVNLSDSEGWTALMHSVTAPVSLTSSNEQSEQRVNLDGVLGKRSCVEMLLLHGAQVDAQTTDGLTALVIAAGRDRPMAVKRLLEFRADVNLSTARGQTPLLMATAHDLPHVVRILIVARADINQTNFKGASPLQIAEKYAFKEVTDLLKKAGATAPKTKKKNKAK